MVRNTAIAEALVTATAAALNEKGKHAPRVAYRVKNLVTTSTIGTIRENDSRKQFRKHAT